MRNGNGKVRLGLPSKGQLGESTLKFFAACGLRVNKTNPRQYTAKMPAMPEVEILFQRSPDIPVTVSNGDIDLGITGFDTLAENRLEEDASLMVLHNELGYGGCSLVVAVPSEWGDVKTAKDLAAYAKQKKGLRVATSYPNLTQEYLSDNNIAPVKVVYASGALEAMPTIGSADLVCDITATGTTLRENHLRILDDGTILDSEASLIANPDTLRQYPAVQSVARRLLERFEANLNAQSKYLLFANMRGTSEEAVVEQLFNQAGLSGLDGPTVARVFSAQNRDEKWFSVSIVVDDNKLYESITALRSIGGSSVAATPITYIFDEYPVRCRQLDEFIAGESA